MNVRIGALVFIAGLIAASLFSCREEEPTIETAVSAQDEQFLAQASQANRAEIALGSIASQHATNDSVKRFANAIVTDHTTAQRELLSLATMVSANANLTDSLNAEQLAARDLLLSAGALPSFDSLYLATEIATHQTMTTLFDTEINSGQNARIKAYAFSKRSLIQTYIILADSLRAHIP